MNNFFISLVVTFTWLPFSPPKESKKKRFQWSWLFQQQLPWFSFLLCFFGVYTWLLKNSVSQIMFRVSATSPHLSLVYSTNMGSYALVAIFRASSCIRFQAWRNIICCRPSAHTFVHPYRQSSTARRGALTDSFSWKSNKVLCEYYNIHAFHLSVSVQI